LKVSLLPPIYPGIFSTHHTADAALLYPPSTHPNIEIATHREPSPIPTRHPSRDGWIAALFTRDDKGKVLILLSVEDTFPSSRAGALRLLARKVKEAVKEAEREKMWAKLRETEEYEWTVHSRNEEEGFVVVEKKK
jgi:hypothetical protein